MIQRDAYQGRRALVGFVLLLGFALVLCRLFSLQVLQAAELTVRADRQHHKSVTMEGPRGAIFDRMGKVLAMNVEVPSVFGMPAGLENPRFVARSLARILPVRASVIERKLQQDRSFVWIARKLDPEQGRRLERARLHGIGVVMEGRRFYPKGPLLAHALGFTGMDGEGLEGIERGYERYLRGDTRTLTLQRDALGRTIFPQGPSEQAPAAGRSLTLTIDEVIQYIVERALEEGIDAVKAESGTAIAMDPRTGAILAMAVSPKFDPNAIRALSPERWRNRAVTDAYEPGSTLKIFTAAAALEEKVMAPDTLVFGENGRMMVANTVIHDHERAGWMTFAQVVQRSSNIGAVKTASALGDQRLYRYLRAFGFGERTEVDVPGETAGLVKEPGQWGKRTLASIAIGQEIGVTPLQVLTATAAVANGGWLMKPYLVSEIKDGAGHVVAQFGPQVRRRPISADTAKVLGTILEGVVEKGTGAKAAVQGFRVAGKTGTAQKFDSETGTYSPTSFVASFVGYVPAEDPRLAVVVVIDQPQGEAWGGIVAAPVFQRIVEQALPYLGVAPREAVKVAWVGDPDTGWK